eukprot:380089-Prorocentrum_minimum.AAC.1
MADQLEGMRREYSKLQEKLQERHSRLDRLMAVSKTIEPDGTTRVYSLSPCAIGARYRYIHSPLARLVPATGIFSPLARLVSATGILSISPCAIGARDGYILSPRAIGARYGYIHFPLARLVPAS